MRDEGGRRGAGGGQPQVPGPPFAALKPDTVLDALARLGLEPDGSLLALNSYENRVYRVGIVGERPRVVKFYRPGRWSDGAIEEEHRFTAELLAAEIPVVAPEAHGGSTLHRIAGFRYCVFPLRGGHWPDLDHREDRVRVGRLVGRVHAVGASGHFAHRPRLDAAAVPQATRRFLLDGGFVPESLVPAYAAISGQVIDACDNALLAVGPRSIRLHGDLHRSNLLAREGLLHIVDLDDCMSGPAVQDLWMFLDGDPGEQAAQLEALLEGYALFAAIDPAELALIEPLRALRMLNYAGWLARRWHDPAFPHAFPWFGGHRYWEEHILDLKAQLARLHGGEEF